MHYSHRKRKKGRKEGMSKGKREGRICSGEDRREAWNGGRRRAYRRVVEPAQNDP